MTDQSLNDKIETLAQELARVGVPIERARVMLRRAIYEQPPTEEEVKAAFIERARQAMKRPIITIGKPQ